jgi:hypothetical protein
MPNVSIGFSGCQAFAQDRMPRHPANKGMFGALLSSVQVDGPSVYPSAPANCTVGACAAFPNEVTFSNTSISVHWPQLGAKHLLPANHCMNDGVGCQQCILFHIRVGAQAAINNYRNNYEHQQPAYISTLQGQPGVRTDQPCPNGCPA